jgi:hypothetical protein
MNQQAIDTLGLRLGQAALTVLVRICPETRSASNDQLEAACAAMRAKSKPVVDELLADAKAAPWMAEIAFQTAALTLAQEGVRVLREIKR